MKGYIKIFRQFLNWSWYEKSEMVHLFLHFLLNANHRDKSWQGIIIKRGQFVTGLITLKKETGLSVQTIRTCIERLKSTGEITSKSTNKFRIITIVNWEKYQKNQQPKKQSSQQTTNNQLTTTKKYKNEEEESIAPLKEYFISLCLEDNRYYAGSPKDDLRLKEAVRNYGEEKVRAMLKFYIDRKEERKVYSINAALSAVSLSYYEKERKQIDWQYSK